jgi:hypothetical protein
VHELDTFPNARIIDDGLSWLPDPEIDWRSVPHRVEERAPGFNTTETAKLKAVKTLRRSMLSSRCGSLIICPPIKNRLSWRPLLSVLCRRIYYTAGVDFAPRSHRLHN